MKVSFFPDRPGPIADGDYGDVTVGGSGTTMTIDNDVVTYAKMQNVSTTDRLLGRDTAGAGDCEELTISAALDWVTSTRGSIPYRGASGWAGLAPGTSGHVLTSNGAGADPSYQAAAAITLNTPAIEYRRTSTQTISSTTYAHLNTITTEADRDAQGTGGVTATSGEYDDANNGTWLMIFTSCWDNGNATALPYYLRVTQWSGAAWVEITGSEVRDGSLNTTNEQWSTTTMQHIIDFSGGKIRLEGKVESGGS